MSNAFNSKLRSDAFNKFFSNIDLKYFKAMVGFSGLVQMHARFLVTFYKTFQVIYILIPNSKTNTRNMTKIFLLEIAKLPSTKVNNASKLTPLSY